MATVLEADPAKVRITLLPQLWTGTLSARLTTAEGDPLPGKVVSFRGPLGNELCSGVTDDDGRAGCVIGPVSVLAIVLGGGVTAGFAGDDEALPSQDQASWSL